MALPVLETIEIAAFRLDASPLHCRRNGAKVYRGYTRYSLRSQTAGIDALTMAGALQGFVCQRGPCLPHGVHFFSARPGTVQHAGLGS